MKKTLKAAVALSVLAAPAYAANLENPLYMPTQGTVYSKTGFGLMYKKVDDTDAQIKKGHNGETEFPIYRLYEDLGYGITDRLELYGKFAYTHAGDIDRKGMNVGRAGLKYRVIDTTDGFAWDVYADMHLGGVSAMEGSYAANGFTYDNYSNGRWGFHVGTQFGKTWSKFTAAAFAEVLRTFGNDNNEIDISGMRIPTAYGVFTAPQMGIPNEISVDLKSTTEFNAGLKTFYQLDDRWSFGGGFTWKRHEDNGVDGLATRLGAIDTGNAQLDAGLTAAGAQEMVINSLLNEVADMNDGFDEYIITLSGSYQWTDTIQTTVVGEITFDDGHRNSQNTSSGKYELGVRLNVQF